MASNTGIYVHFAFCRHKCDYCDFNSCVGTEDQREAYLRALLAEVERTPSCHAQTVYFGGGTPTIYPPADLARVLAALQGRLDLGPEAEVTVEANPGTVTEGSLRDLRDAGFNRLSLGVQSLRDEELQLLGRIHTADEACEAVDFARRAGFDNLSVDLIRGLPNQRLEHWQDSLCRAIDLVPDHFSAYGLTVEDGTPLKARIERGELPYPEAAGDPAWIEWTVRHLDEAGYRRYEVSNYARPGSESRHNINYWRDGDYIGLGAGAWSYTDGERRRNVVTAADYTRASLAGEDLVDEAERLGPDASLGEAMMLGLRMVEGVSGAELHARFGVNVYERYEDTIRKLIAAGLMVDDRERLRLTFEGMLVQNAVAVEFLA